MISVTIPEKGLDGKVRDRQFRVDRDSGWTGKNMAAYLQSKVAAITIR
jgi:hypothetical protein